MFLKTVKKKAYVSGREVALARGHRLLEWQVGVFSGIDRRSRDADVGRSDDAELCRSCERHNHEDPISLEMSEMQENVPTLLAFVAHLLHLLVHSVALEDDAAEELQRRGGTRLAQGCCVNVGRLLGGLHLLHLHGVAGLREELVDAAALHPLHDLLGGRSHLEDGQQVRVVGQLLSHELVAQLFALVHDQLALPPPLPCLS